MADPKKYILNKDYKKLKKGDVIEVTSVEQEQHFIQRGLIGEENAQTQQRTAEVVIAEINAAASVEEVEASAKDDARKTVIAAAEKKKKELSA